MRVGVATSVMCGTVRQHAALGHHTAVLKLAFVMKEVPRVVDNAVPAIMCVTIAAAVARLGVVAGEILMFMTGARRMV